MTATIQTLEVPISGMDCAECTLHVQHAIAAVPGVEKVDVFLASEKAIVRFDPAQVDLLSIRRAVARAGYQAPEISPQPDRSAPAQQNYTRSIFTLFGVVFFVVLFAVVVGEWLGLFEDITALAPWPIGAAIVLIAGWPVFRNVIAALIVGQWVTAALIVFFMRVGDYAERFTTERARHAVKDLTAAAQSLPALGILANSSRLIRQR